MTTLAKIDKNLKKLNIDAEILAFREHLVNQYVMC